MFFILFGVVTLVFILFSLLPSPEQLSLGQRSDIMSKEAVEKELGINQPVITRYFHFLNDLSPLSIHDKNPENQEKKRFPQIPRSEIRNGFCAYSTPIVI